MKRIVRIVSVLALAALVAPVSAQAGKPKPAAWAAKHDLTGNWRAKDADRDGLKNQREFKLGTNPRKADSDRDGLKDGDEVVSGNNPRKADSDRDGVKDGAEHPGVVTSVDGETATIRQFNGPALTVTVDSACAEDAGAEEEFPEDDWGGETEEEIVDLGDDEVVADDASACDALELETGDVLKSAEVEETDGVLYLIDFELA
jgi:hypothetical protein